VADGDRAGIDLRFEGDLAAMAVSIDLHASCPVVVDLTAAFEAAAAHLVEN
jgi:hypothetical protein